MRLTRILKVAAVMLTMGASAAMAQVKADYRALLVPRFDLSVGYEFIRANAPPADCGCFSLNGGYVSGGVHVNDWFSVVGQFTGVHAGNISLLGQDLTLTTFTGGPRISFIGHRFSPFAEVLAGAAHGGDSYFPSRTSSRDSATSFAVSGGGGLDINLTQHFAVRALNVQYLRTSLPNGNDNGQNHLAIGAGIVFKFGGHDEQPSTAPPPPPPPPFSTPAPPAPRPASIAFTCGTNVANVPLGQTVEISGDAKTEPESMDVSYAWTSDAGTIEGSGRLVTINTTGMAVGDYRVKGHASLVSNPSTGAECVAVFRVIAVEPPAAPTTTYIVSNSANDEKLFHENVKDAFFDYNSAAIRPDAQTSIDQAAAYLTKHPSIHTIINGWADPRGSQQYNLALGLRRANAVRNALIAAGVAADHLEVLSNGKSSQVCTTADKACFQENRRVSFAIKP